MQVGSLVNHLDLGRRLIERGLLPASSSQPCEDFLVMVVSTKGGMQYFEYDMQTTADGSALMQLIKSPPRLTRTLDEVFPWWEVPPG